MCLRTVVVLGLQLLVQAERAGALHGREHSPVQVEDVRFRLQEGLDGSGIRALRVESSLRRPVQVQDVRFRLLEAEDKVKEAKEKVAGAENDLFSAYNTYRWAVDYGILN